MNRLQKAIAEFERPILGVACYLYNPTFLEMASLMGYKGAWIEMEHTFLTFGQVSDLCRIASGLGMLTMIRVPDSGRETVLKAAECGPDIIDLPMANSPEQLRELVHHGRFPPQGIRGFFSVSRAVKYGLDGNIASEQAKLNEELCLMVQVETKEAVDRVEELCEVPGIDAIFIGPADLSASLGVPGQTGHPKVLKASAKTIKAAQGSGKHVATAAPMSDFPFWIGQNIDLLYCTNDIAAMKLGAQAALNEARDVAKLHANSHA